MLTGENVTSYNMPFDFRKYLDRKPWELKRFGCVKMPDIMEAAAEYFKEPSPFGGYRWPRLERAYKVLCKDDPAGINNKQEHRALSDGKKKATCLPRISLIPTTTQPQADISASAITIGAKALHL